MMKNILSVLILAGTLVSLAASAQTNPPPVVPPIPAQLGTNLVTGVGIIDFAINLWPSMDPTLTNTFASGEFEFGAGPAWKAVGPVGLSPYLNVRGGYMFTRNFGADLDMITLGSGVGQTTIDSTSLLLKARVDRGNVAAYFIGGPDREFSLGKWAGRVGIGLEYRYRTGIGISADTSYIAWGTRADQGGWLHCLRLSYPF